MASITKIRVITTDKDTRRFLGHHGLEEMPLRQLLGCGFVSSETDENPNVTEGWFHISEAEFDALKASLGNTKLADRMSPKFHCVNTFVDPVTKEKYTEDRKFGLLLVRNFTPAKEPVFDLLVATGTEEDRVGFALNLFAEECGGFCHVHKYPSALEIISKHVDMTKYPFVGKAPMSAIDAAHLYNGSDSEEEEEEYDNEPGPNGKRQRSN